MATSNQGKNLSDVEMSMAETSMTGQELLRQIATMVDHNQLAMAENVATSPIDNSPAKNSDTTQFSSAASIGIYKLAQAAATSYKNESVTATDNSTSQPSPAPPIVYGELSILGYNGYIPNSERGGRRNRSKFLLCKRSTPNGIKKSEHYIVRQPQATKAIQDKDNYSISYTFSRSQTIIVEYKQDDKTDLFQIGRSSEDPIDFVVMDTVPAGCSQTDSSPSHQHSHRHHHSSNKHSASSTNHHHTHNGSQHYSENASSSNQMQQPFDLVEMTRFHRHLAKVEEEMLHRGIPPYPFDPRGRLPLPVYGHVGGQQMLLNYPQPNLSNLPPLMAEHFRRQDPSLFHMPNHPTPSASNHHHLQLQQQQFLSSLRPNYLSSGDGPNSHDNRHNINHQYQHNSSNNNNAAKRSHAAQSTISRFACRIIVEREPPYTARIFAAGFDSSKNIFLGEKATKWEQNNSIDGLTTNGILLMHPKRGYYCETKQLDNSSENDENRTTKEHGMANNSSELAEDVKMITDISTDSRVNVSAASETNQTNISDTRQMISPRDKSRSSQITNDSNNNSTRDESYRNFEYGGVWREVSVDGGIYAIRESRSAAQKGRRIENETNILQDGTLIDLCGATLLWRSVDGFKSSPTKRTLEEKIDLLNASRPQCPVGLNTLVIPRKPILPGNAVDKHRRSSNNHGYKDHHSSNKDHHNHHHSHHSRSSDKGGSSQQPYVYLKCGHVQGYHDWGTTEKSNQRTCPICLSVGNVAKLSMGLEPSFYVDSGPLTHVFNPCGHMASERTIKYWTSIKIPHGTHFFHSICPFCATPVATDEPTSTRLIFQGDLD